MLFIYNLILKSLLRIRLVKTGSRNKKTYRIVVAEKQRAVKKKYIEFLGYYIPTRDPKTLEIKADRIKYWISKGAQPSDSTAVLFKTKGIEGMEKFMVKPRDKKRLKKSEIGKEEAQAPAAPKTPAAPKPEEAKK